MLDAIILWSLRNKLVVVLVFLALSAAGAFSLLSLPMDAFPDTTPVQVQINTSAPSLGPLEIERRVSLPVEQAIAGLPRLEEVRSLSRSGLSQVIVTFHDGTDIWFARALINERLQSAELPEGTARPRMGPVATGLGEVFHYTLSSQKRGLMSLRTLQDWVVKPALRTVPGTAEINSWGGVEKQYQARIDPARLVEYGVTFDDVEEALKKGSLDVGGGHLAISGATIPVRGLGRASTLDALRDVVVMTPRDGVPVKVGDVAEVRIGGDLRLGSTTAQGKGEVVLGLGFMIMGENSHAFTHALKKRLDEVKPSLPEDVELKAVYDRTELVDQVLDTVRRNLFEGGLLVIAVLFLFLGNLRAGLIVALAIPISMLFAFSGMLRFGIAGSLLSLGAIDFGLIVDSSVVMVENCVRHLSENKDETKDTTEVVREAALEVRGPTLFGELIICIVYLPILTLEGVEGKLFRPMALTVIFALAGSMLLSLTLMPVLAALLLPRRMDEGDPWVVRLARFFYRPLLRLALNCGPAVLLFAFGTAAFVTLVTPWRKWEFVPKLNEGAMVVAVLRLPGTSLEESMRSNTRLEKMLFKKFPDEVENVWSRVGSGEVATDPMGPEETDLFITLKPREEWTAVLKGKDGEEKKITTQDELTEAMRELFNSVPGHKSTFKMPIKQRIDEMTMGVQADVAVKIFGDDLDVLLDRAEDVERILKGIAGSRDVGVEQIAGQPTLEVKLDAHQVARHGLTARAVFARIEALGGRVVGDVSEGQLRFPLAVRLPEKLRRDPDELGRMLVVSPSGEQVPLSLLASLRLTEGPARINREWGQRRAVVQCNVQGRDVATFAEEARRRIREEVSFPSPRYRVEIGGQFETLERARLRLMFVVPVALLLIFLLLYASQRRIIDVLLIFLAVPFASAGGLLALQLRGLDLSIPAAVGFIALSGVSVLNSMLLVTFIRQLLDRGRDMAEAAEEAALTRLRPVLMTALVAGLGFVPMALSTGVGAEVQRPLATVVIGGVISSTLLTLFVLPVLYKSFVPGPRRALVVTPPA